MNRDRVREQLEQDEGVKYHVYRDHLDYKTFGIGHLVLPFEPEWDLPVGHAVQAQRVEQVFNTDLDVAIKECSILYENWDFFPEEVQEVLVNMLFNLGRPRLSKFKNFKVALDKGNWKLAATEGRDSVWYRQVSNRAERLMGRLENVINS